MILIIGSSEEYHSNYIYEKLKKIGEDVEFFDSRLVPNNLTISWHPNEEKLERGYFKLHGKKIKLPDIKSVYWRYHYGYDQPLARDNKLLSYMLQREIESAYKSLFSSLDTCLWCNPLCAIEMHKKKTYQLHLMAQNGIRVPKTIITNNKDDVLEFLEQNKNEVIYKPVLGGASTSQITKEDLDDDLLSTLENSPVQFQELVDGVDIRVYVVGNEIFPAEIRANSLDFRDDKNAQIIPVKLPDDVIQSCLKLMPLFNLNYSGIDIRRNNNGEYVFIEANPAPMFVHFEKESGYPISDTLIKLLRR